MSGPILAHFSGLCAHIHTACPPVTPETAKNAQARRPERKIKQIRKIEEFSNLTARQRSEAEKPLRESLRNPGWGGTRGHARVCWG